MVHDYIHQTPHGGRYRIRLYLPNEEGAAPVVILTEPVDNTGQSITKAASRLAAEVIAGYGLEDPQPVFVEHYEDGARGTEDDPQTFDLVVFRSYALTEHFDSDGWAWRVGAPKWSALDRQTVEALVGEPVQ